MEANFEMNTVDSKTHIMDVVREINRSISGPGVAPPTHWPSHHLAPGSSPRTRRTTTRNEHASRLRQQLSWPLFFVVVLVVLTCCLPLASASVYIEEEMVEPGAASLPLPTRYPGKSQLLVDPSPPPNFPTNPKAWVLSTENDDLRRLNKRADDAKMTSSASIATTTSSTASTTSSSAAAATTEPTTPLPTPFDQGFGGNLTQSCSNFMNGFLSNATFISCLPFSLLLQTSVGFFQASKSILRITQTLDATCSANISICQPLMAALATNLTSTSNCASDLSAQNPQILYAKSGLEAYQPLYTASCLHNPTTFSYCYADAITNASSPTDPYIYYMPVNISLPGGSQPTCNSCLKNTMAVFEAATSDRSSAIASNYVAAAQQINVQCGPGFVSQSLAAAIKTSGALNIAPPTSNIGLFALAIVVGNWFLG